METVLGAGVVAGTVYYGLALREQHKERQAFVRRDQMIMQALEAGGAPGELPRALQQSRQWLLLVHVHEVEILDPRLEGAAVSVLCKYGHPTRSLRRETHWMRAMRDEEGKLGASHHETFVFAWSTDVAPYLRFRLRKLGRFHRTVAKATPTYVQFGRQNGVLNLVRQEDIHLLGMSDRHIATVKVIYEARCVALSELYQYGFQVGHVVSHIGLQGADVPLVQGVDPDQAPPIGEQPSTPQQQQQQQEQHVLVGHVVPESPTAEGAESELDTVSGASADGASESESNGSSSASESDAEEPSTIPRGADLSRHRRAQGPAACGCCR